MTVLNALRVTLESHPDRLAVVYQPICALGGKVLGVEALARWNDPDLGQVPPSVFIEVAEMSGYAHRIGELIRGTAIDAAAAWRAAGWDGYLSVNVSAAELASDDLAGQLASQLELSGLDPAALCAEVTETSVMADREAAGRVLVAVAALGVSIAIDDFGTGYSSLAYLKRFPVSVLKMDREFVDGVGTEGEDRAICAAIVALAGALGMRVVAEGVETAEQLSGLVELGVDSAQGWWFSKPVPAHAIPAMIGLTSLHG
jgi:EAL domain-containing protein (putative c-di-GMP-specific phosphodiesterase class I)